MRQQDISQSTTEEESRTLHSESYGAGIKIGEASWPDEHSKRISHGLTIDEGRSGKVELGRLKTKETMEQREIKFRLWFKGTMYVTDYRWGSPSQHGGGWLRAVPFGEELRFDILRDGNEVQIDPQSCEIMQFTGVCNRSGEEVWEGDVLEVPINGLLSGTERIVVEFTEGGYYRGYAEYADAKILGNIYEHPHLLESAK